MILTKYCGESENMHVKKVIAPESLASSVRAEVNLPLNT